MRHPGRLFGYTATGVVTTSACALPDTNTGRRRSILPLPLTITLSGASLFPSALPMASSKDMHDWGLTMETCRLISREDFDNLVCNDCKPMKNDILITKDGANYLKHIFVNRSERDVVLLSSIAVLRPNARINPHLLAAILSYPENKNRLKNYVTGAAIPRIILKDALNARDRDLDGVLRDFGDLRTRSYDESQKTVIGKFEDIARKLDSKMKGSQA